MANIDSKTWVFFYGLYLLLRHYVRSLFKWSIGVFPFFLFLVAFSLFAVVLAPNFRERLRKSELISQAPLKLHITGTVFVEVKAPEGPKTNPSSGIIIEVGGYQTTTDSKGTYELKFQSKVIQSIPVVLRLQQNEIVERISFPTDKFKMKKDFTFR